MIMRKGHPIKRIGFWVGMYLAPMLGKFALVDTAFAMWFRLGWRKPVAHWMLSVGMSDRLAGLWGLFWVNVPDWIGLVLIGLLIGRYCRRPILAALVAAAGFKTFALLYSASYIRSIYYNGGASFAVTVGLSIVRGHAFDVLVILTAAWYAQRRRKRRQDIRRGFVIDGGDMPVDDPPG